ncbi:MAG: class I SAM-dependent methyltransferase [Rhodothermales bacterium]|nr:class I SAM-dependent methyltransferase [Rhodothermales bacterium]
MDYDPVKDRLVTFFGDSRLGQRLFFGVLHLVFLRSWYVRRVLRKHLGDAPSTVLDAGTGFGQYTDWILRRFRGAHVVAVDIKRDYLARVERYLERAGVASRAEVRFGDLTALEETGPFDLILCVDVMEHIEADVQVFKHFHRVLRPGGVVVVNTPSDQGGSNVSDDGEDSFIGEHVRDGYGVEEIRAKLAEAGLTLEAAEYGYGPAGTMGWSVLVQLPMLALGRSMAWALLLPVYYLLALPVGLLLNAADMAVRNETGTGLTVVARKRATE